MSIIVPTPPTSSSRLRPWLARLALPLSVTAAALGCSFEEAAGNAALKVNTCSSDADCGTDARCAQKMCLARDVTSDLRVVLEVTPQPTDGRPSVPFAIDDLRLTTGRLTRSWTVADPVRVQGRVRNKNSVVEADVTLTATVSPPGLLPKVTTATVASATELARDFDYELSVASAGEYMLRVQPKNTSLPPVERLVTIEYGEDIDVDYGDPSDVELYELELTLNGASDERPMIVRAFDSVTGALISSASPVVMGKATLRFAGEPESYRIVVRPDGAYDPDGLSSDSDCDHDTPVLPTLSIASSAIEVESGEEGNTAILTLPVLPERVPYHGSIELCDAPGAANTMPTRLPVTLRSKTVLLDDDLGMWTAEVSADTEAALVNEIYGFCVDVFQGTYDLIITPPAGQPCEILAEERTVAAQEGSPATAPLFQMVDAAELAGEVLTHDMMALAAAAVDVKSLAREVELDPALPTLTGYNRSQQVTTDANGAFVLTVDRGSYDVTFKPPPGSGYAWYVLRDVTIGARKRFTNTIDMASPVAIDCSLSYEGGGASLAGADVIAFAIVEDAQRVERAIPIGTATADMDGRFMLLLPSSVREGW